MCGDVHTSRYKDLTSTADATPNTQTKYPAASDTITSVESQEEARWKAWHDCQHPSY
jgi:hypothetical protein